MILKMRIDGSWKFVDRIKELDAFEPKETQSDRGVKRTVQYVRDNGEVLAIPLSEEAYLLNDNGGTIEKLVS